MPDPRMPRPARREPSDRGSRTNGSPRRDGAGMPTQLERWRDGRAMLAAVVGRCPNCREGKSVHGLSRVAASCPVCGVRFERDPGSWLGAAVIAYGIGVLAVAVVGAVLVSRRGLFAGLEWWLVATAVVSVLVVYRPVKGWWLWVMWAAGWVHRDREDPEARSR